jgi:hypothetical protein
MPRNENYVRRTEYRPRAWTERSSGRVEKEYREGGGARTTICLGALNIRTFSRKLVDWSV